MLSIIVLSMALGYCAGAVTMTAIAGYIFSLMKEEKR